MQGVVKTIACFELPKLLYQSLTKTGSVTSAIAAYTLILVTRPSPQMTCAGPDMCLVILLNEAYSLICNIFVPNSVHHTAWSGCV